MRNLPQLLRDAERRVNAHVWPNRPETAGADDHLASIPANRDTDTDLLLIEAADRIEALEAALESISNGEGAGGLAETERLQEIARAALTSQETPEKLLCDCPDGACRPTGTHNFRCRRYYQLKTGDVK